MTTHQAATHRTATTRTATHQTATTRTATLRPKALFSLWLVVLTGLTWLTTPPPTHAQWASIGSTFDISQAADCNQAPAVAVAPDGRFVVVWDQSGSKIMGRRYAADGTPEAAEATLVSAGTARRSDVAMAGDASFAVVWEGASSSVRARRFDATGVGIGSEQIVDSSVVPSEPPSLASAADGRFVVVWIDTDMTDQVVRARRYGADGLPLAAAFEVYRQAGADQRFPDVAMRSDGAFVVTWVRLVAGDFDVLARRYDAAGTPAGAAFLGHAVTAGPQLVPEAAITEAGEVSIAWQGQWPGGSANEVIESPFSAAGVRLSEARLGSADLRDGSPDIALSNDGGTRFAAFIQRPAGSTQIEHNLQLTAAAQNDQHLVGPLPAPLNYAIALDDRERGVVVWTDVTGGCGSVHGHRVQVYRLLTAGTQAGQIHGLSAQEAWKHYVYFPTASPASVTFTLTLPATAPQDADLYVEFGNFATLAGFVCRSFLGGGATESCTVNTNGAPILVGVNAFQGGAIDFNLQVSETAGIFYDGFESGNLSAW